ncbi:MAG: ATP-binding protein, partial [Bacteroidota bacterium]
RRGFLKGRVHDDDIDGIIKVLRRFHKISYIKKAISIWTQGDSLIAELIPVGDSLHTQIKNGNPDKGKLDLLMSKLETLNHDLTLLEDEFSFTLGEGSRWLENIILKLLFTVALTVEITGLLMTISVSRAISRGLKEIIRATTKISHGDLSDRATVFSGDEIGQVAMAVNQMTGQLVSSNKELSQFAYIASHDLQEPLRTISNYAGLIRKQYEGKLDENHQKYLDAISRSTSRMQLLIKDILDYSQIGENKVLVDLDINSIIHDVLEDMATTIAENNVTVNYSNMPVIRGYTDIRTLFQNLISNAIKFRKANVPCVVKIQAEADYKQWTFSVADNGIGIENDYKEKIFTIFQKLHSRKEYPGSGIGLAHCRKIVELHGGRIWVEGEFGTGSTFYFTIPKVFNP